MYRCNKCQFCTLLFSRIFIRSDHGKISMRTLIEQHSICFQAIRVITDMIYETNQESPLLIVVRQIRGVISWTLPYTFSNG